MRTSPKPSPDTPADGASHETDERAERGERDYVMALEKGLAIIEAFGQLRSGATLTELADVTGHTKASVRRSLHTLCHLGYATQDGRQFQLAARALRLGSAFVVSDALTRLAQPILETTAERTKESASIAVLDSQDSVFVARATHRRSLSVGLGVGARLPAYASATGRVLLAGQPRDAVRFMLSRMGRPALTVKTITSLPKVMQQVELAQRQGYALCDQELEIGLRSIAVPILDRRGRTIAAMSLSVATSRMDIPAIMDKLLPELERAKQKFPALL
ncbi:IclR family transcriptional regulator C-terminal domain-containing protein [Hydrogenophaga sp. SNF1]|uniref:IclR family transcriptional regulator n=1 Tax=Hydrogenophaga borbori TaxID=2294117 RepID=A0A372EFX0_9BURK|nr:MULTISPECIES: IclR family transcriptional regulator C-terminal domain-containing protein [Hydrogenophaga]RFP77292.1 IclR family transcriptional regulator [Hydrogenophaga borbori]WQB81781.1 IclR family transcriptional regulator C-terminal domain-containing protein [Hydrogenophaga sp. SNF1]